MRIWFELTNSPHINLFAPLIRELEHERHEVLITCRALANTVDLLELHGLRHHVVGRHYGGRLAAKLYGFPVRVGQLCRFLADRRIEVAVSQSAFHSPVAARLLGLRSIYMNDNEHALGNVPAFLCADTIMVPEFMDARRLRRQGAAARKVLAYPGVKEGLYLWRLAARLAVPAPRARRVVYCRPEPSSAQYYKGGRDVLDDLLLGMKDQVELVLLPRGEEQGRHYRAARFAGVRVVAGALDIADIAPDCDLFIGAGGTMTREMAVLGIPTISVYRDALLGVDRHLIAAGALVHRPWLTAAQALGYLEQAARRAPQRELLEKGRAAYALLKQRILNG